MEGGKRKRCFREKWIENVRPSPTINLRSHLLVQRGLQQRVDLRNRVCMCVCAARNRGLYIWDEGEVDWIGGGLGVGWGFGGWGV